jgi:multidrug efflux pump subunit AcrA (membrane-fusion protein)
VLTIGFAAMQYRYGVNRVFVVVTDKDGEHLAAREIKVGDRLGDRIEVVGGLKAGEPVATTDVDKLVDGTKVSVDAKEP